MNPIIYDVLAAAVLILALWQGYRKGFVLTLCGCLAFFVALIGGSMLASALAEPVSQLILPLIQNRLTTAVAAQSSAAAEGVTLPALLDALRTSEFYKQFVSAVESAINEGVIAATGNLVHAAASYIALRLAWGVLFLLSFVVVLVAWTLLSRALDLACKLPVLSTLNHWSGAAVGLVKGLIIVYAATWLLKDSLLTPDIAVQTHLVSIFYAYIPMPL